MIAWQQLQAHALSFVLPKRCVFCGTLIEPIRVFCKRCESTLPFIKPPVCTYCGQNKKQCGCPKHRFAFDKVAAPFYYEAAAQDGILRLKHYDDPDAIRYFAEQLKTVVLREYGSESIEVITFVPMTKRALCAREYNQSQLLAEELGKRLWLPVQALLTKLYETRPQKELDLEARTGNLLGVFDVTDPTVRGKAVLLVDDVMTTGATLHECAKMLKIFGAKHVLAVTVAVRKFEKKTE